MNFTYAHNLARNINSTYPFLHAQEHRLGNMEWVVKITVGRDRFILWCMDDWAVIQQQMLIGEARERKSA